MNQILHKNIIEYFHSLDKIHFDEVKTFITDKGAYIMQCKVFVSDRQLFTEFQYNLEMWLLRYDFVAYMSVRCLPRICESVKCLLLWSRCKLSKYWMSGKHIRNVGCLQLGDVCSEWNVYFICVRCEIFATHLRDVCYEWDVCYTCVRCLLWVRCLDHMLDVLTWPGWPNF